MISGPFCTYLRVHFHEQKCFVFVIICNYPREPHIVAATRPCNYLFDAPHTHTTVKVFCSARLLLVVDVELSFRNILDIYIRFSTKLNSQAQSDCKTKDWTKCN